MRRPVSIVIDGSEHRSRSRGSDSPRSRHRSYEFSDRDNSSDTDTDTDTDSSEDDVKSTRTKLATWLSREANLRTRRKTSPLPATPLDRWHRRNLTDYIVATKHKKGSREGSAGHKHHHHHSHRHRSRVQSEPESDFDSDDDDHNSDAWSNLDSEYYSDTMPGAYGRTAAGRKKSVHWGKRGGRGSVDLLRLLAVMEKDHIREHSRRLRAIFLGFSDEYVDSSDLKEMLVDPAKGRHFKTGTCDQLIDVFGSNQRYKVLPFKRFVAMCAFVKECMLTYSYYDRDLSHTLDTTEFVRALSINRLKCPRKLWNELFKHHNYLTIDGFVRAVIGIRENEQMKLQIKENERLERLERVQKMQRVLQRRRHSYT